MYSITLHCSERVSILLRVPIKTGRLAGEGHLQEPREYLVCQGFKCGVKALMPHTHSTLIVSKEDKGDQGKGMWWDVAGVGDHRDYQARTSHVTIRVKAHTCNPALRRVKQEDHGFKASLGYLVRLCLKLK